MIPSPVTPREGRLRWAFTLGAGLVLLGVPLAGRFVAWWGGETVVGAAFGGAFLLSIVVTVGVVAARTSSTRSRWAALAVLVLAAAVLVRSGVPAADRTHLFEYGLLALLLRESLAERIRAGGTVRFAGAWTLGAILLLGALDEGLQILMPDRVGSARDLMVDGLAGNIVYSIAQDATGAYWFGTNRGLSRYDGATFSNFTVESGLPGNDVYAIAATDGDDIWVGTRNGVARLAPTTSE